MTKASAIVHAKYVFQDRPESSLAASITRAASKQTYYTIRLLADRDLVEDAYRAYAYFRWVDDMLDGDRLSVSDRLVFLNRQQALVQACYRSEWPRRPADEENMLVELIRDDREPHSGLQAYIRNLMGVMAFDANRRGRLISEAELDGYTHQLAVAVMEAIHYFIGHGCRTPQDERRYQAVEAAHITHMLRDTLDDIQAGYFNAPREMLEAHHIGPEDVHSPAYRDWVRSRIDLARARFQGGSEYLRQVENRRCRLAAFAYVARFTGVLNAIEREEYRLRPAYPECKSWNSALSMIWSAMTEALLPL